MGSIPTYGDRRIIRMENPTRWFFTLKEHINSNIYDGLHNVPQFTGDRNLDVYKLQSNMSRCSKWHTHFDPTKDIRHWAKIPTTGFQDYKIMITMASSRTICKHCGLDNHSSGLCPEEKTLPEDETSDNTARTHFGFVGPKSYRINT